MADGITIRIVGDDSDFMRTLASLEEQTRATLDGLAAAASLAGEAFGAALGGAGGFDLSGDEEELARRAARLAETVARAWSGAAVLEAPSLAAPQGLLDLGPLLERALSSLEANLSAAAETLRAAIVEGYLRPGFEGVDWEGFAAQFSERLAQTGMAGARALAVDRSALSEAGQVAQGVPRRWTALPPQPRRAGARPTAGRRVSTAAWVPCAPPPAAARSVTAAFNAALGIASPSKVFQRSGRFTGEGFILGYEESIREAQRTVRGLTGGLISAANFPARGVATVAQNAQTAGADGDELSRLNIGLYISDRKIAEATADASERLPRVRSAWRQDGGTHDEKTGIRMV